MSDINVTVQDEIVNIDVIDTPVVVEVTNSPGPAGAGVAAGGTTGQVLAKASNTNYDTVWVNPSTGGVPYSGATGNVNLGEYELKAGQVTLDTSPTGTAAVGTIRWNDTTGTSETTLKGGNVIIKNGVDLVARVVNKVTPNTTLTKAAYQAVRVSGAQGQRLAVALAQANNDANSADTIGLVTETIPTNQEGFIITVGQIENINTTGSLQGETWVDGDVLYLSPTTAGAITKVKPTGAGHIVVIGYVEYAHANNGKIYVKVMNGWELDELHDVSITSVANNEALIYESSSALWKNKSIATALGYTPANAATTLTINGVTYDLSANRSWTIAAGISGSGASGQVAYWDGTSSISGENNLFWDAANNRLGVVTNTPRGSLDVIGNFYLGSNTIFQDAGSSTVINQTAFYPIILRTNNAERVRLFETGNFGIGTGASDGGQRLQVQGTTLLNGNVTFSSATGMFWDATNSRLGIGTNTPANDLSIVKTSAAAGEVGIYLRNLTASGSAFNAIYNDVNESGAFQIFGSTFAATSFRNTLSVVSTTANGIAFLANSNNANAHIKFVTTTSLTERMRIVNSTGNIILQNGGTFLDSGERLQVTGTMKVTGASSFGENITMTKNSNAGFGVNIVNTTSGVNSNLFITLQSDSNSGSTTFGKYSTASTAYKIIAVKDAYLYNNTTAGDISILNDFATGAIKFGAGGASTPHMTIKSNGRINMSSLPTSSTGLATGDLWNDAGTIKIV